MQQPDNVDRKEANAERKEDVRGNGYGAIMKARKHSMRCTNFLFLVFLLFTDQQSLASPVLKDPVQIKLAGTHWCPYTCAYSKHPGFVSEFIRALLEGQGVSLTIDLMPWGTAVQKAKSGEYDGLITAVVPEAPQFIFTHLATDVQQSCFYTKQSSTWSFDGLASLKGQRLGVIAGYGYGTPVDEWIASQQSKDTLYVSTQKAALIDLLERLESGDITTLIEDRYVISHVLYRNKREKHSLRIAGCLADNPFYLAMNPKSPHARQIVEMLDKALQKERNQKLKRFIKSRYGLNE